MELIHWLVDIVLHLDAHLVELLRDYGFWVYLICSPLFAETGLVVTLFLPAIHCCSPPALAAVDTSGAAVGAAAVVDLVIAAVPQLQLSRRSMDHRRVQRQDPFPRSLPVAHRGVLSSTARCHRVVFVPILRTCAPSVAGIGRMPQRRGSGVQHLGGRPAPAADLRFFFGNIPFIKKLWPRD
jgi:membrane-associated protein